MSLMNTKILGNLGNEVIFMNIIVNSNTAAVIINIVLMLFIGLKTKMFTRNRMLLSFLLICPIIGIAVEKVWPTFNTLIDLELTYIFQFVQAIVLCTGILILSTIYICKK